MDWTHVPNTKNHVLRAALATKSRAITLYEKGYSEKELGNGRVEKQFLIKLKALLPEGCSPIILTDGGFRNPWFKQVLALSWDYIGRIRGTHTYYDGKKWISCKQLLSEATRLVKQIGNVFLCQRNTIMTNLFLYKGGSTKRIIKKKYRRNQGGNDRIHYTKSAKEPWLLASSLPGRKAHYVIRLYKMRMQIEEGFRDLKSSRYGYGLRHAYSKTVKRINVLLMIAALASFIAWLIGSIAEENNWQYQYQANSQKNKRVLSLFFLGSRIIKRHTNLPNHILDTALQRCWRYI